MQSNRCWTTFSAEWKRFTPFDLGSPLTKPAQISAAEADALIADLWEGVIAWAAEQTDAAWWIARRAWTLAAFIDGWYAEYATDDEEA